VSHTAVATVAAIESTGATPLLIDIEPDHYTMDPAELAQVLADPPPGLPPIRAVIRCISTARWRMSRLSARCAASMVRC